MTAFHTLNKEQFAALDEARNELNIIEASAKLAAMGNGHALAPEALLSHVERARRLVESCVFTGASFDRRWFDHVREVHPNE